MTKRRFVAAPVALAVLVIAVLPVFGLKVGETSVSAFSKTGPARSAYDTLVHGGSPGRRSDAPRNPDDEAGWSGGPATTSGTSPG